jgi:hypothetical protein
MPGVTQFRPQVQPPQPQPPDAEPVSELVPAAVANENRRRTRALPHLGHESSVRTEEPMGRRSSNRCSQPRQMYS